MHSVTNGQNNGPWFRVAAGVLLAVCLAFSGCAFSPKAKEARYLESGKKQLEKKDYARALIQFRNAAKVMPKDAEPHYQMALVFLARREARPAYENLTAAVKLNPKHEAAQLKLAQLMASSTDQRVVEKAQAALHEMLKTGTASAEELDALAMTEMKLGNPQDAEKHLEEAFAKFPKDLTAAVNLAAVKLRQNDVAGAEDTLKKATAQTPPSANAFIALGRFYMSTNRAADAETQFRRAVQIDPKYGAAILSLAIVQLRANKVDEAERSYAQLSALPDKQFKPYHAAFLAAHGKHDQAITEFEKIRKDQPDDRALRSYLVREYLVAGRSGDAEKLLAAALAKNSKDVEALIQRGGIYVATGRIDEARKDVTEALHFSGDSPQAHYLMARVERLQGSSAGERQELSEALRLRPLFLPARIELCQSLIASGAAQAALDLMDEKDVHGQPVVPPAQKNTLAYFANRNWALIALQRLPEARKEVDRGLAALKAPDLLLQDAYLKLQAKEYAPARASLTEALEKSPEDIRVLKMIVASYAEQKQLAAAVPVIQEYAARRPKSAPVQYFLAELLLRSGQPKPARAALLAAKAANPKFGAADVSLAQLDLNEGRLKEAASTLQAILAQNPKNAEAHRLLAAVHDQGGNHDGAVAEYKKALDLEPSNLVALNNLAYILADHGAPGSAADEALKYAQKAAELAPNAPAIENTLGWVLYRKGLFSMALPHLERSAEKEPTARRKCQVAMAYFKMGDHERGQKNLDAALKLDPSIPEIRAAQEMDGAQGRR